MGSCEAKEEKEISLLNIEPIHRFSDGIYLREIFMPKGCLILGKKHKFPHFLSLLSGVCAINGALYTAPYLVACDAGVQRFLYAHDDCRLMTIHSNPLNLRDPLAIDSYYAEAI